MYKISPSDLTFGWDGCRYCFYLKVKHGIALRGIFPGIFGKMANLTSQFYLGRSTADISPTLPPGSVKLREGWVKSEPIAIPGRGVAVLHQRPLRRGAGIRRWFVRHRGLQDLRGQG